ncbi:hypothetical protein B0H11DRAFT_1354710 [Mycena galericulata]|nr:hypothetical protein B0H11DRAFT_1354710 [Mycena galericulata]
MGAELELTVTITYGGDKARISTPEEAYSVIRPDLFALAIPLPKRINVSVVYPGTVRFYWIALPNSVIHKNLKDAIRPSFERADAHRNLLTQLSIERINLRESDAVVDGASKTSSQWKPDVSLHATPMGGFPTQESTSGRNQPENVMQILDEIASSHRRPSDQRPFRVKTELEDTPIPPFKSTRAWTRKVNVFDEMDVDRYRRPSTSVVRRPTIERNRYAPRVDAPQDTEAFALRRELREVRHLLNEDIAQERMILQQLRDLGVEESPTDTAGDDFVTRARIQHLEEELEEERAKRRQLDKVVADIRRECREPFVVPSLLDAFIEISKLTNEAMEEG